MKGFLNLPCLRQILDHRLKRVEELQVYRAEALALNAPEGCVSRAAHDVALDDLTERLDTLDHLDSLLVYDRATLYLLWSSGR